MSRLDVWKNYKGFSVSLPNTPPLPQTSLDTIRRQKVLGSLKTSDLEAGVISAKPIAIMIDQADMMEVRKIIRKKVASANTQKG